VELSLAGGVALGLASALHCASMCGGLSLSALMLFNPAGRMRQVETLALIQAGRITVYVLAGALAGAIGSGAIGLLEPRQAAKVLQWAATVSLMWIGLSLAGLMPVAAAIDGRVVSLAQSAGRLLAPLKRQRMLGPYSTGLMWGISPCPMVYGALFTAALTGSAGSGAVLMLGFGAGTVPAVAASALGLNTLLRHSWAPPVRVGLGITTALAGFLSLYTGYLDFGAFCLQKVN